MSDNKKTDNGEFNIDSIISREELEKLRRRYGAADPETSGDESAQPAGENEPEDELPSSPTAAAIDEQPGCLNADQADEAQPDDQPSPVLQPQPTETGTFSADSIEKLTSSFRIIYEDSVTKLDDFIPTAAENPQPAVKTSTPPDTENVLPAEDDIPSEYPEEPDQTESEEEAAPRENRFKRLRKKVFPVKGDSIGESIRKIVLFCAIITMLVCCGILLNLYVITPFFRDLEAKKASEMWIKSNDGNEDWAAVKAKYPDVVFPDGMQIKHADLYATNPDFVGWLEIPGIDVSMPIVQGENNDIYLSTSFYGVKTKHGCCFIDSSNDIKELDRNTIIHGHNMSHDDLMFGQLEAYKKMNGFKASPLIKFDTLYNDTRWKVYAVFLTNGDAGSDYGYLFNYLFRNLSSDMVFKSYIDQIDKRTIYITGVDLLPTDKILTLSTCTYEFNNARLVVIARLLREGESEEIDVSKVKVNEDPLYPNYWYIAAKEKNPYKNKELWFPS